LGPVSRNPNHTRPPYWKTTRAVSAICWPHFLALASNQLSQFSLNVRVRHVRAAQARRGKSRGSSVMSKALVLGAAALVFSAASASAQVYTTPDYGYAEPVADLAAPADGYAAAPPPAYTAPPVYAARFIHHRQSTWCQLPSTRLQWCRAITQRPWFRGQYMPTRPGIGVATGTGGAATATGMVGAKPAASRRRGL
jgi:hypothetical protein